MSILYSLLQVAFLLFIGIINQACNGGQSMDIHDQSVSHSASDSAGSRPKISQGVEGVITAEGNPLANVLIQAKSLGDQPVPDLAIVSDNQGNYSWHLLPGKYEISVSVEGYQAASEIIMIKPSQVVQLNFDLKTKRD